MCIAVEIVLLIPKLWVRVHSHDICADILCAIVSGWELQVQADWSFDFCASKLGVITFGVNSLRGIFQHVSWSIVPDELWLQFAYR